LGVKQPTVIEIVHRGGCAPDACFVIPHGTGIAFVGDHVAAGGPPVIAQGNFERWAAVLATLKKNKSITMIVPGRGTPGAPAAMIDETADYIKIATTRVKALIRANRSRSDVVTLIPELLARYAPKGGRAKTTTNLDSVHRQVRAGLERIYDDLRASAASAA
jgi:glyoxylase-like metal-dependent hydrolase (beta-lactamase superfamily II)